VTAELAVTLPTVILIASALLGAVKMAADHAWLASTASSAARAISIGIAPDEALARVTNQRQGVLATFEMSRDLICVTLRSATTGIYSLVGLNVLEKSCMPRAL